MSLHAQLSPEAIARLHAQKRNSTISSLVIALLVLTLIGLILGLFLLPKIQKEEVVIVSYSYEQEKEKPEKKVPKETVQKKPSSPSASVARVITSAAVADVAIPVPEFEVTTPSLDFGESSDFGSGWGSGTGGNGFQSIPSSMRKRCSAQERMDRLKEMGGTAACEKAVVKALDWLQETQNEDGSWTGKVGGHPYPVAMTGMAILAYLGHCETPKSPKYGKTVEKGITYLVNAAMSPGKGNLICSPGVPGHAPAYEHGIATYALAESYTFCKEVNHTIPNLKEVTKKAGERILDGQTNAGGYVYGLPNGGNGGDNSVGYWQLQALKAFKHTKIISDSKFKRDIRNAMGWFEKVQGKNGAIGYRNDSSRSPNLTGGALLCMQFWGEGDSKMARKAADWIRENVKFGSFGSKDSNLYYHYYHAQAMINVGGKDWDKYQKMVRDPILKAQQSDGSWKQTMGHGPVNHHMATCLATMLLEVYYRFLPGTADN